MARNLKSKHLSYADWLSNGYQVKIGERGRMIMNKIVFAFDQTVRVDFPHAVVVDTKSTYAEAVKLPIKKNSLEPNQRVVCKCTNKADADEIVKAYEYLRCALI